MIRHRYISVIIYFVISSSVIYPAHLAVGKKNIQSNTDTEVLTDVEALPRQNFKLQPYVVTQKIENDGLEKINKQWSKVGILGTSILFLLMVFILFKEEKSSKIVEEPSAKVLEKNNAAEIEDFSDSSTLAVEIGEPAKSIKKSSKIVEKPSAKVLEKNNAAEVEDFSDSSTLAVEIGEPAKSIKKASFLMIGMDLEEESNNEPEIDEEVIEVKPIEGIRPEMTIAEVSDNVSSDSDLIVDSDIMGKLTIMASDTTETEIDIVFELIQDLHQSSQLEDTATGKDLRRKAIWALGQSNDFRAVEPLIQTIPIANSLEKGLILDAITQIANRSFASINQAVQTSLEDDNAEVRKNAIQDLTSLYQSMSFITIRLSKMVNDRDLEVRQTATWALEKFNQMSDAATSVDDNIRLNSDMIADNSNGKSNYLF